MMAGILLRRRMTMAIVCLLTMSPLAAGADTSVAAHRAAPSWDQAVTPTVARPQAIGSYARGCQSGALPLPLVGTGYQVLRPQRLRYYGQPSLLQFIAALGQEMAPLGHGDLLVGDMSQPRGGPMSYGHSSHQSGLDVDIWLRFATTRLSSDELTKPLPVSMVAPGAQRVDPVQWTAAQEDLIHHAAKMPGVARIFVNPAIKASLCERYDGPEGAWLRVLRPWRGHDEHIHVRLTCPAGDRLCESQEPPPAGTGCGEDLMAWFQPLAPSAKVSSPALPKPRKPMPVACDAVLAGQDDTLHPASYNGQ